MPPLETVATILVPSPEHATADQALVGAEVSIQFWPRAEEAAKKRLPAAMVTRRRNLVFIIAQLSAAMCRSALINRLGPGAERLIYPVVFLANRGVEVNQNCAFAAP